MQDTLKCMFIFIYEPYQTHDFCAANAMFYQLYHMKTHKVSFMKMNSDVTATQRKHWSTRNPVQ